MLPFFRVTPKYFSNDGILQIFITDAENVCDKQCLKTVSLSKKKNHLQIYKSNENIECFPFGLVLRYIISTLTIQLKKQCLHTALFKIKF